MKKAACILAAGLSLLAGTTCLNAADFDYRGRVEYAWDQDNAFNGEDYWVYESGSKEASDVINWRCSAAPSPLDNSLTLVGVNGKFSTCNRVQRIDNGLIIKFDISAKNPSPKGNHFEIDIVIRKFALSFVPPKKGEVVGTFGKDGKMAVVGPFYEYDFDLSASKTGIAKGVLKDYRGINNDIPARNDCFRLNIQTADVKDGQAHLELKITRRLSSALMKNGPDSAFMMLPLKNYFTRSLKDDVENDGKGGWTDQGSKDMSMLKPGVIQAQGIPFKISDGAIILRGEERKSFPAESKPIPVNEKVERIAFCHTAAWCETMVPAFYYRIAYTDKTKIDVPVYGGLDVSEWSAPLPPSSRSKTAWENGDKSNPASLSHFQWKNPKPNKTVKSVQVLSANGKAVPAVLAITILRQSKASDQLLTVLNNEYAKANVGALAVTKNKKDWFESGIDCSQTIEPNSALDVSFLLHKPAGKYGFVKKVGNHFEFEKQPGKRVAFWGTCIQSAGPRREFVPMIVDRLKKSGVNIVRIHIWMLPFHHPACPEENARSFIKQDGSVDMKRLDDFYYFFSELKKNGIYIYMDTIPSYCSWLPGGTELHYRKDANDRIKEIAKLMYTTKNPYTGLAIVDDPAFAMCEIHNEYSAGYNDTVEGKSAEAQKNMQDRWTKWKKDHNINDPNPLKGGPVEGNGEEGRRFYTNVQKEFLDDWYAYLRKLGVKVPISGTNLLLTAGDLVSSQGMDFMEDHSYCGASPTGGLWAPVESSWTNGPITANGQMNEILHSRLDDKPIVCTEWSDVYPHPYRMEGYPLYGAFAAYQQVDGMFSFDWAGSYLSNISDVMKKGPIVCLSQPSDPASWGLNVAIGLAFLRGDIQPAKNKVVLKYTYDDIWQNHRQNTMSINYLFQMARVSIQLQGRNGKPEWPFNMQGSAYNSALSKLKIDAGRDYILSDTKELKRFSEPGLFIVDTPRSQFATGNLASLGKSPMRTFSAFAVNSSMNFATMTFSSLDNEPLTQSSRILMCAVGNTYNADSYMDDKGYHEGGKCPILSEPFYAVVSAMAVPGKTLKVYTLDPSTGKRTGELKVTSANGVESFSIDKNVRTMYMELVRK